MIVFLGGMLFFLKSKIECFKYQYFFFWSIIKEIGVVNNFFVMNEVWQDKNIKQEGFMRKNNIIGFLYFMKMIFN